MYFRLTNKTLTILLAVASIAFVSCKKDRSPGNPGDPGGQTKRISRIEQNGNISASFTYNADGTLKTISTAFTDHTVNFAFSYNAQKKVTEFASDEGYKSKYVYINNVLDRTENYEDGQKISENIFTYENNRIKSNTLFTAFPQGNGNILYKPTYRAVYSYYGNGNVQRVATYTIDPVTDEVEPEFIYMYQQYDGKKNPLAVISDFSQILLYQPIHINNPLLEEMLDGNGTLLESTGHVYTYDAAGYPVTAKSTITPVGGTPTVIDIKYFY
ncbi:MAG TPA: hypothetical protein VD993_14995 [Chitinophagaceae bacterium]|nr:hypothetical protein [Chitinophagaceae bacterium]